jgi:hypothetical protein
VHANQTIDLHLRELPAAAVQRFEAQRGTYRVSGASRFIRRWAASPLIHPGPSRRSEARRDRLATNGEVARVVRDDGTYQPYFAPQR